MSESPPTDRAPTIYDVARAAGVSHQTVSRVLNDHPSLRAETRDRVLAAMDELDYRPSSAARALVTSRTRTVGILTSESVLWGPASSIKAIEVEARAAGYLSVTVNIDGHDEESIRAGLGYLLQQGVEGLVVIAPQIRVTRVIEAAGLRIPHFTLQASPALSPTALGADQIAGARRAVRHLIDLGHTEIVHLAGPQDWIEAEARMTGYLREMSDADLETRPPLLGDWSAARGYRVGRDLISARSFTAIFAGNDHMALGLIRALYEAGIRVPEEVSVIGFDDVPEAEFYVPALTTIRQDFGEVGRRTIAALLAAIEGRPAPDEPFASPELIVRDSTGPARQL